MDDRLQFILGTESGMITSIVAQVKRLLKESTADIQVGVPKTKREESARTNSQVLSRNCLDKSFPLIVPLTYFAHLLHTHTQVEIVFPVSVDAISAVDQKQPSSSILDGLTIIPGTTGGEGCSAAGGCASCPYMKMNSLAALEMVCEKIGTEQEVHLQEFVPRVLSIDASAVEEGIIPIVNMREFQVGEIAQSDE